MTPKKSFLAIIPLLFFILSVPTVFADSAQTCLNTSTLAINADIILDGTPMAFSENVTCPYGCRNNDCAGASMLNEVTLIIVFSVFAIMLFIGYKFNLPPSAMIAGVFMLILSGLILSFGIVISGTLYTIADSAYVTYLGIMFIGIGIYAIATGFKI